MKRVLLILTDAQHRVLVAKKGKDTWEQFVLKVAGVKYDESGIEDV